MKVLILSILVNLFSVDPTDSTEQASMTLEEWKSIYEQEFTPETPCCKVYVVDMKGNILESFDLVAMENNLIPEESRKSLRTSSFMFESMGNQYYLKD
jgi:hypothetical protein